MDLPDLNAEILATPVTEVEQAVGRILRKCHDKLNPIVIDLVDNCGNFVNQGRLRAKFYKDEDYEIQDLKIPLGQDVRDLQPFIHEIDDYLSHTEFKKSKKDDVDEEDDDDNQKKNNPLQKGKCLLTNDTVQDQQLVRLSLTKPSPKLGKCLLDDEPVIVTKPKLLLKSKNKQ